MQISITILSQTGGHGDSWEPCGAHMPSIIGIHHPGKPHNIVDGPEEMRKKVRELIRAGADVIKVCTSGGVLSPRDDPRHGHYRDDELDVLVAEATAAGKWVMAHAQATDGIKSAVRAGIRSIEHGIYLDDEAIAMMFERGTYLVPTLIAPMGVLAGGRPGVKVPQYAIDKTKMVIDVHRESIRQAIAAGVKVAMGTDSGVTPHGQNLRELEQMVACGMTPAQAMIATTRTAAELMGLEDDRGAIEVGKRADLVIATRRRARHRRTRTPDPHRHPERQGRRRERVRSEGQEVSSGFDVDDLAAAACTELHCAVGEREQRVVATDADVAAGVELGAALTNDDGAGVDLAAAEDLHAEALRVGVAPVAG